MWRYVDYLPVTAFGLRPSNTTASGGKSLICPTPYAIKMALLDRLLRADGEGAGRALFPLIRDLALYIRVPDVVAVNRTFQKVLRPSSKKDELWTRTIAQREFCFHGGVMTFAMPVSEIAGAEERLSRLFAEVGYFGRRGSFFQWAGETWRDAPPGERFVEASRGARMGLSPGFLQRMDDMLPEATFDDISVFNSKAKGARTSYTVVYPYVLKSHGAGYTVYAVPERDVT
ncbi:MAG: hypothetical protein HUU31_16420 [Anaerolineae bacterium]|nr:hypothetical protein [Anaerolineae bacterium]